MSESPFKKFGEWFAVAAGSEPNEPEAVTVATVGPDGRPAARMVLLKRWDERGFVFFSHLPSRKGQEMAHNPHVALLFHWKSLQRQIRIEGLVAQVSDSDADEYFATRPRQSQIGAWASDQSRPLASRELFEERIQAAEARFLGREVTRPDYWSGWRLAPDYFEFWQGVDFRLHDRLVFTRAGDGWETGRLFP
jgi:pyridoxamine 5'-phosphate oxidase